MPHVPGAEVAVFERGDLRHHEYEGPHQDRLDAAYRLVELAAEHGSMTRLPRRVPDIRPERQRPRYLGALHPAAAPPERRRAPSSRRATTRSTMLPTVTHDIPSRRLTAVRSVTCARYAANSSNPDVNTPLPLAHGTCSTFTPRQRRHDTRHGAYRSHAGIRPHDRCRHSRTGCRSYRGARFPHVPLDVHLGDTQQPP